MDLGRDDKLAELIISGDKPLCGEVTIGGRKNSAVAVIPATLLAAGTNTLSNLPAISDICTYNDILRHLGAVTQEPSNGVMRIDTSKATPEKSPPLEMVKAIRASYYLLGALLGRFGYARVGFPGGCNIGQRPIDQHLKGFKTLGAKVHTDHGEVVVEASGSRLQGAHIYLDVASVGATINIMLAAVLAEGTTVIENVAREPHIVDVASCLNSMGAKVVGAGTDTIKIHGVQEMQPTSHAIIPDEIEAATYAIAGAATRGDVTLINVVPKHLDAVTAKLGEAGIRVEENGDWVRIAAAKRPRAVSLKTLPYPGFPTDAMPPMMVLLSLAEGTSMVSEGVFENRFDHVEELQRMGTNVRVEGRTAVIEGVKRLHGTSVKATNLRAGAALVIAGLRAEGETVVSCIEHVDRGYEHFDKKIKALGADITRVQDGGDEEDSSDGPADDGDSGQVVSFSQS